MYVLIARLFDGIKYTIRIVAKSHDGDLLAESAHRLNKTSTTGESYSVVHESQLPKE